MSDYINLNDISNMNEFIHSFYDKIYLNGTCNTINESIIDNCLNDITWNCLEGVMKN